MSIQAMKGVEIGDGFRGRRPARERGPRRDPVGRRRPRPTRAVPLAPEAPKGGMTTGGLLVARRHEAARHPQPSGAAHRRHRHQGGDGVVQGAHRRHRGARVRASWPRRWSRSCSPRRPPASSGATRSTSSSATTPRTSPRCDSRADEPGTGAGCTAPRARRADGRGKTTVGQRCAELLDRPFVDTDQLVEATTGDGGGRDLRAARRAAVPHARARCRRRRQCVARTLVIACGGGAVLDADNRRILRSNGVVVWLRASPAVLGERVSAGGDRPLPAGAGAPVVTLERLAELRAPAYDAAAHVRVDTEGRHRRRGRRARRGGVPLVERVTVALEGAPYDVVVGAGRARRRGHAPRRAPARRGGQPARRRRLARAAAHRRAPRRRGRDRRVPHRRRRRRQDARHRRRPLSSARRVGPPAQRRDRRAGRRRGRRHRRLRRLGVPPRHRVVQAPTTLLAQVDAAIGGKTAVNLPEGKNLVGAFHQPLGVFADVTTLATFPPREYRAGLGEVAKYALMPGGERVAAIVDARASAVVARDLDVLTELVAACAAIKAHVVAADPEERTGIRATLNLGHTLAHAGVGRRLRAAARRGGRGRARLRGRARRCARTHRRRRRRALPRRGCRARPPDRGAGPPIAEALLASMRRDKKSVGGLTFVLPGPIGLETVHDPDPARSTSRFAPSVWKPDHVARSCCCPAPT